MIEAYISEHGRDPVTGEDLTVDDLLDLKSARVVKPRPPTLTSIPSLLSVFQQEWDALALESFQLKQHVNQLRNELSSALYNNDAAIRVIARLTKERDEARDALARMSLNDQRGTTNGGGHDAMQVDGAALPETLVAKVEATQEQYVGTIGAVVIILIGVQAVKDAAKETSSSRLGNGGRSPSIQTSGNGTTCF